MEKTEEIFTITNPFQSEKIRQSNWKAYIWILFIIILPFSGILIGFYFRNDCPLEKSIPLWEIVNGFITIIFLLLMFSTKQVIRNDQSDFQHRNWVIFVIDQLKVIIIFFLFAWFISGNVSLVFRLKRFVVSFFCQIWVYRYYKIVKYEKLLISPSKTMTNSYCNRIVYLYAFWYMTTIYILLGLCLIYYIFSLIYNCVKKQQGRS